MITSGLVTMAIVLSTAEGAAGPPERDADRLLTLSEIEQQAERVRNRRKICGPLCAAQCLRQLGLSTSDDELLRRVPLDEDGVALGDLIAAIKEVAPETRPQALRGSRERLSDLPTPAILILRDHCVVYAGRDDRGMLWIVDPAIGTCSPEPPAEMTAAWDGEAIVFQSPQLSRSVVGWLIVVGCVAFVSAGTARSRSQ